MSWLRLRRLALFALAFALALVSPAMAGVLPVSPGAADRLVEVTSACPDLRLERRRGRRRLRARGASTSATATIRGSSTASASKGAAFAWAPSREECLAPGRVYAWLVRADVAGGGLGEWSAPRRFRVPGVPSIEEVDAALALLERWRVAQPGVSGSASGSRRAPATGKSSAANGNRGDRRRRGSPRPRRRRDPRRDAGHHGRRLRRPRHHRHAGGRGRRRAQPVDRARPRSSTATRRASPTRSSPRAASIVPRPPGPPSTSRTPAPARSPSRSTASRSTPPSPRSPGRASRASPPASPTASTTTPPTRPAAISCSVGTQFSVFDGRDSGLDADKLDGLHADDAPGARHRRLRARVKPCGGSPRRHRRLLRHAGAAAGRHGQRPGEQRRLVHLDRHRHRRLPGHRLPRQHRRRAPGRQVQRRIL